jgi:hypothetical protein
MKNTMALKGEYSIKCEAVIDIIITLISTLCYNYLGKSLRYEMDKDIN